MRYYKWIVPGSVLGATTSFADEACKPTSMPSPAVSLSQFYETAEAKRMFRYGFKSIVDIKTLIRSILASQGGGGCQ